ncbi:cytochrome c biogenesis CcdA family protein [Paenibacillus sp. FJAT-27812]|uniref:cytochrome c biogenesis CcdA family protein n=1 Tax=Paenibacillus sp. FJAT-27812 TaxID=1684143 RepID=UPI0006A7B2DC|nr:cytochrome c biogenesis protein CcdA [Paenibacillus sp. FJAT-27812]
MDFILAFSAGLLSFLSPCVLPLIPVYLSYMVGSSLTEINTVAAKRSVVLKSLFFIVGFSLIFVVLGVSVSSVSKLLSANLMLLKQIGGILIILFALHMLGLFKIKALYAQKKFMPSSSSKSNLSSFVLGMAFAAGWTPCIGPILSSILLYAGSMETIDKGVLLLAIYSLGLGVPFMLSALLVGNLTGFSKRFAKYLPAVSIASGVIMLVMGILVLTNKLEMINSYFSFFSL